jgi:hypothetical protein
LAESHNSRRDSSEKTEENSSTPSVDSPRALALKLAADLARQVGMVRTWPNLQTIRLAIEGEADFCGITLHQSAALIMAAAGEWTRGRYLTCAPAWEEREVYRANTIDRFWFEDSRWRGKASYHKLLSRLSEASA